MSQLSSMTPRLRCDHVVLQMKDWPGDPPEVEGFFGNAGIRLARPFLLGFLTSFDIGQLIDCILYTLAYRVKLNSLDSSVPL